MRVIRDSAYFRDYLYSSTQGSTSYSGLSLDLLYESISDSKTRSMRETETKIFAEYSSFFK